MCVFADIRCLKSFEISRYLWMNRESLGQYFVRNAQCPCTTLHICGCTAHWKTNKVFKILILLFTLKPLLEINVDDHGPFAISVECGDGSCLCVFFLFLFVCAKIRTLTNKWHHMNVPAHYLMFNYCYVSWTRVCVCVCAQCTYAMRRQMLNL